MVRKVTYTKDSRGENEDVTQIFDGMMKDGEGSGFGRLIVAATAQSFIGQMQGTVATYKGLYFQDFVPTYSGVYDQKSFSTAPTTAYKFENFDEETIEIPDPELNADGTYTHYDGTVTDADGEVIPNDDRYATNLRDRSNPYLSKPAAEEDSSRAGDDADPEAEVEVEKTEYGTGRAEMFADWGDDAVTEDPSLCRDGYCRDEAPARDLTARPVREEEEFFRDDTVLNEEQKSHEWVDEEEEEDPEPPADEEEEEDGDERPAGYVIPEREARPEPDTSDPEEQAALRKYDAGDQCFGWVGTMLRAPDFLAYGDHTYTLNVKEYYQDRLRCGTSVLKPFRLGSLDYKITSPIKRTAYELKDSLEASYEEGDNYGGYYVLKAVPQGHPETGKDYQIFYDVWLLTGAISADFHEKLVELNDTNANSYWDNVDGAIGIKNYVTGLARIIKYYRSVPDTATGADPKNFLLHEMWEGETEAGLP